jgi:hypothetical protein
MENELKEDLGEKIISRLKVLEIIILNKLKSLEHEKELPTAFISGIRSS